jgi:hypothetical protein
MHPSTSSDVYYTEPDSVGWAMQDPLNRADHYRKEAVKCDELAKYAQPAFLGDFYLRPGPSGARAADGARTCPSPQCSRARWSADRLQFLGWFRRRLQSFEPSNDRCVIGA